MKVGIRILLVLVIALAAAPASLLAGTKVSSDYDKKADLSHLRTCAWKDGTAAGDALMEQKIHMAVEAQLQAKGLTQTDSEPDIYVVTHASSSSNVQVDVQSFGYGGWYGWNGWVVWGPVSTVQVHDIQSGMLIVDILSGETKLLVWRGVATSTLGELPDPDRVGKKILTVTSKMFRDFPPPAPGK